MTRILFSILIGSVATACTESKPVFMAADAATLDSGSDRDTSPPPTVDSGQTDTGETDTGHPPVDAHPPDTATPDSGPEPVECGAMMDVDSKEALAALVPAEFGAAPSAAARRLTADLRATAEIVVAASDFPRPSDCAAGDGCELELSLRTLPGAVRDGDNIRIASGTTFRMRFATEFIPLTGPRGVVLFERACSNECEATERRCSKDRACYNGGQLFCLACDGLDPDICACRVPEGTAADETECQYVTGDVVNVGECQNGLCQDMVSTECCVGETISWYYDGGLRFWFDTHRIVGCNTYDLNITYSNGDPSQQCRNTLPACSAEAITPMDLADAIAHPDVTSATPGLYGLDDRPVDGSILKITIGDGPELSIGAECGGQSGLNCARPLPDGLAALARTIQQLQVQESMRESCARVDL